MEIGKTYTDWGLKGMMWVKTGMFARIRHELHHVAASGRER